MPDVSGPVAEDGGMGAGGQGPQEDGSEGGLDMERLPVVEAALADVEHAMARLDAGTWGTCEHCGAPLDQALLVERPAARACPVHA